jgi:saccharopine dehydrogenase-like NADP-dependent oxidoreductase
MKILVLGSGLMGPAAAFNAMTDPQAAQVCLADISQAQLALAQAKLAGKPGAEKLTTAILDLADQPAASRLIAGYDAVVAALPKQAIPLGIRAAVAARIPLVDLSWPRDAEAAGLKAEVEAAGGLVILGCGVEPGLTEIMARYLAEKLDRVDELHIKCGGIPEKPAPPLGYKIVFGGRQLPLRDWDGYEVVNGKLTTAPRYGGVEPVVFAGVGECEAWHETFMPWLLDLEALKGLKTGTQKTVRWPGYAARVTTLKELGLLGERPIDVDGVQVAPKKLLDALLYPHVRLEPGERDITVFRVEVAGEKDGRPRRYRVDMVDRYDPIHDFTSMARTTAFTGAIVARMIARGDLQARGWLTPERVITAALFDRLVRELAETGVLFEMTTEKVERL